MKHVKPPLTEDEIRSLHKKAARKLALQRERDGAAFGALAATWMDREGAQRMPVFYGDED